MFDVLTDEQWVHLQELVDNPPEHVRVLVNRLRMLQASDFRLNVDENESVSEAERVSADSDIWMPGPDSWRPGMPLPESYRIQRNTGNFPRPQN